MATLEATSPFTTRVNPAAVSSSRAVVTDWATTSGMGKVGVANGFAASTPPIAPPTRTTQHEHDDRPAPAAATLVVGLRRRWRWRRRRRAPATAPCAASGRGGRSHERQRRRSSCRAAGPTSVRSGSRTAGTVPEAPRAPAARCVLVSSSGRRGAGSRSPRPRGRLRGGGGSGSSRESAGQLAEQLGGVDPRRRDPGAVAARSTPSRSPRAGWNGSVAPMRACSVATWESAANGTSPVRHS